MRARPSPAQAGVAGLVSFLLLGVVLWLFLPTSLGGRFSYAIVNGNSMSPLLKTGDLVLLRSAGDYEVGDAVAYQHPLIGPVLHRIVADDGERFTLQGDNRDGADSYDPLPEDVIGRQWVVLPNGGRVVYEIQKPRNLVLLVGAAVLLFAAGGAKSGRVRRRGLRLPQRTTQPERDYSAFSPAGRQALILGMVLLLGSGAMLTLFLTNGRTQDTTEAVAFTERGVFGYGGTIGDGVYDGDELGAPEPLYRQLANDLPLTFNYDIAATSPDASIANVLGSYGLVAVVGGEDGWTRIFPLIPSTPFASAPLEVSATLRLATLEAELAAIAAQTGVEASRYSVRVIATIEASGQIDGIPFEVDHSQFALFRLSPLQLQFDGTPADLTLTESGSVGRPATIERVLTVPVLPISFRYSRLPVFGGFGLAVSIALLFVVGRASLATAKLGEAARIRATYGALLVEVAEARAAFGPVPHDVTQFTDLVRLASAEGLAIMHRPGDEDDEYFVNTSDRSWRYRVQRSEPLGIAVEGRYITTTEG